jgi:hypothetical protein
MAERTVIIANDERIWKTSGRLRLTLALGVFQIAMSLASVIYGDVEQWNGMTLGCVAGAALILATVTYLRCRVQWRGW